MCDCSGKKKNPFTSRQKRRLSKKTIQPVSSMGFEWTQEVYWEPWGGKRGKKRRRETVLCLRKTKTSGVKGG